MDEIEGKKKKKGRKEPRTRHKQGKNAWQPFFQNEIAVEASPVLKSALIQIRQIWRI